MDMGQILVFKNRIRMWRAEKRLSQADLAEMVGVSRQTISSIENLQFCPSARLSLLISMALEKTFEEVYYFELEDISEQKEHKKKSFFEEPEA